jgi:hypothetical protein
MTIDMREDITSFGGGFLISVFGNISWILQLTAGDIAMEWAIKVFGTMILGVIGGLAGLFAKDLYKWIKRKGNI